MTDVAEARATDVAKWVPGLAVARSYQRAWLRNDLVAGLILTALLASGRKKGMTAWAGRPGVPDLRLRMNLTEPHMCRSARFGSALVLAIVGDLLGIPED